MASSTAFCLLISITFSYFTISTLTQACDLFLTVVNNCPFTIWPAIQPNSGYPLLQNGGFALNTLTQRSFPAPTQQWSGRIWARTGCDYYNNGQFSCATGDCSGRLECGGLGGATPFTLAEFNLHYGENDLSSYDISLIDGFNLPATITPHQGKGNCPVVGCRVDLLPACPDSLQLRCPPIHGSVVGCKSGCGTFGTDELCCKNYYNDPKTCHASEYSVFFKNACPSTYTYGYDVPNLTQDCSSPSELKVIFCH